MKKKKKKKLSTRFGIDLVRFALINNSRKCLPNINDPEGNLCSENILRLADVGQLGVQWVFQC